MVPSSAKKQQLANLICEQLIDRQVLSVEKPQGRGDRGALGSEDISPGVKQARYSELSFEQQMELMKLQHELLLEQKKQEFEQKILEAQEREKLEMGKKILDAQKREKDRLLELEKA